MTEIKVKIDGKEVKFDMGKAPKEYLYQPRYVELLEREYNAIKSSFGPLMNFVGNSPNERDFWLERMGELLSLDFEVMKNWKDNLEEVNLKLNELRNSIGLEDIEILI